jgi:hypothetical protein
MKKIFLAITASLAFTSSAQAVETRFSAMVSDIDTGFILTADRIDSPRDPSLLGRLATMSMAIQDIADGSISGDEVIKIGRRSTAQMDEALEMTALGEDGYRAHMTGLVNRVGQNAHLFELRLDAVGDMAGLQATAMRVVRGSDGGPAFEGYTTPRDMMRMAVSVSRAFPHEIDKAFATATGNISSTHLWLYQDGMCLLSADGPLSGRSLAALITGAPDQGACLEAAAEMVSRDDARILEARRDKRR